MSVIYNTCTENIPFCTEFMSFTLMLVLCKGTQDVQTKVIVKGGKFYDE